MRFKQWYTSHLVLMDHIQKLVSTMGQPARSLDSHKIHGSTGQKNGNLIKGLDAAKKMWAEEFNKCLMTLVKQDDYKKHATKEKADVIAYARIRDSLARAA